MNPPASQRPDLPLVTLVTPAYNQAEFLEAAIDSVLAQTYPAIEYLVVDDGSTDDTLALLQRLGDRVRWRTQPNAGQARTINDSWRQARGEIVGYLSSDDLLMPDAVASAVAALQSHPQAVACYGDFDLIDAAGRFIRTVSTEAYDRHRLVSDLVCLPGPGAFLRRAAFQEAGGWNPQLRQIPDFDFWMRLSRVGPFVRIDRNLAAYRIHAESASFRQASPERADEIVVAVSAFGADAAAAQAPEAARSQAMAHLIAARSHLNAGRLRTAGARVSRALRLAPRRLLQPLIWRMLLGGLLRRAYYVVRAALGRNAA